MSKPKIILISGKQGSGKTTLSSGISDHCSKSHTGFFFGTKFADTIHAINDVVFEQLEVRGFKSETKKDRELMQFIGAWGRKKDENFWVDRTKNVVDQVIDQMETINADGLPYGVIIDDCRFPNELTAFCEERFDVIKIRLECPEAVRKGRAEKWGNTEHESETALDGCLDDFDFILMTDDVGSSKKDVLSTVLEILNVGTN